MQKVHICGSNSSGVVKSLRVNDDGELVVNLEASAINIGDVDVLTMPPNTVATGNITTANTNVTITLPGGSGTVGMQITGTWVGQIDFQGSVDGTNYHPVEASNGTAIINATAGNDIFILPGAGYVKVRAISTAGLTGTAVVTLIATVGTAASILTGSLPAGTNLIGKVSIDQATANANEIVVKSIMTGTTFIGRTGIRAFKATANFSRPADTTLYTAGDACTNSTSAPGIMSANVATYGATNAGFIEITNVRVVSDAKGATLPQMHVWIFPATFTATNDNAALSIVDATAQTGGVVVPCYNTYYTAVNSRCVSDPGSWIMQLAAADTNIFFCLQVMNGYTPVSAERFDVFIEGYIL